MAIEEFTERVWVGRIAGTSPLFVWLVGLFSLFTFVSNAWNVEELLNGFAEASGQSGPSCRLYSSV